jgi:hypothetical protein
MKFMIKIELKELFTLSIEWTVKISKFYADFRDNCDDVSFRKLLTTMIDQERQYTEYYKDNLAKLNIESDFVFNDSGLIDLNDSFEDIFRKFQYKHVIFWENCLKPIGENKFLKN